MSKAGYRLRGKQKVYICPLSDLHLGSDQFNRDYFEYALDTIDAIQQPKRIYLLGDLCEAASLKIGNSSFKAQMSLDDQIDEIINIFKPFKNDIYFSVIGNHEGRLSKSFDLNIMRIIAKALHCDYGSQTIDTFNINGEPFNIYIRHGKGSSMYAYTAQGKTIRETQNIDFDLAIEGHNHRLDFFSLPIRTSHGLKRKYFAFSGSFLSYLGGYADAMGLPVLPEAFQTISINKDKTVKNNPYYIDQVAPHLFNFG